MLPTTHSSYTLSGHPWMRIGITRGKAMLPFFTLGKSMFPEPVISSRSCSTNGLAIGHIVQTYASTAYKTMRKVTRAVVRADVGVIANPVC